MVVNVSQFVAGAKVGPRIRASMIYCMGCAKRPCSQTLVKARKSPQQTFTRVLGNCHESVWLCTLNEVWQIKGNPFVIGPACALQLTLLLSIPESHVQRFHPSLSMTLRWSLLLSLFPTAQWAHENSAPTRPWDLYTSTT